MKLYTDHMAYDYYANYGVLDIWNEIDLDTIETMPSDLPNDIFWAAGKLFALQHESAPVMMMDTDLIVWNPIEHLVKGKPFVGFHREDLIECYPEKQFLKLPPYYVFNPKWDWTVRPVNTALAWFGDEEFKNYYTSCAIHFMRGNVEHPVEMVSQMVTAEQRIVAMCAKEQNVPIDTFLDCPYCVDNADYTHLWGIKMMAGHIKFNSLLCMSLLSRLKDEHPEYYQRLSLMERFQGYIEMMK
ncbi:MAG: hypothetical protein Q4D14_06080 [Bacteroidales bacterium]|nr:hypothetical protein [Bacteroidales bacterium]